MNQAPVRNPSVTGSLKEGIHQGFYSYFMLLKVMVPVYIVIAILKELHVTNWLETAFSPFMKFFGLPGDAALVIVSGWLVNLYGAIAALAGLNLSVREVTILAVMLGISHSLVMETAIIGQMKARPMIILIERILLGLVTGFILNLILPGRL